MRLTPQQPEPLEWRPRAPAWKRLKRAIAAPVIASSVVFVVVVLCAIFTIAAQPHSPNLLALGASTDVGAVGDTDGTESRVTPFSAPTATDADADADTQQPVDTIFVHVVGEVLRPGLIEVERGTRVAAALESVGGPTPDAALSSVNLARVLTDGEQVVVPHTEDAVAPQSQGQGSGVGVGAGGLISLNSADQNALETLPRVGPSLAQRIIDWREQHGGFSSIEQLLDVSGIGEKTFEQLRELVSL